MCVHVVGRFIILTHSLCIITTSFISFFFLFVFPVGTPLWTGHRCKQSPNRFIGFFYIILYHKNNERNSQRTGFDASDAVRRIVSSVVDDWRQNEEDIGCHLLGSFVWQRRVPYTFQSGRKVSKLYYVQEETVGQEGITHNIFMVIWISCAKPSYLLCVLDTQGA
jgi:hypothetical protein